MQESDVPSFLLIDVHGSSDDRKRLTEQLQTWALWREVYGSEPYDHKRAIQLRNKLRLERQIRLQKDAAMKSKELERAIRLTHELHRSIGEFVFDVEVFAEHGEVEPTGMIDWTTPIHDKISKANFGTPHSLLMSEVCTIDWTRQTDCRDNLTGYIEQIKEHLNGFQFEFAFERPKTDIESKSKRYCKFLLRLTWRSRLDHKTVKKIRRLIAQASQP